MFYCLIKAKSCKVRIKECPASLELPEGASNGEKDMLKNVKTHTHMMWYIRPDPKNLSHRYAVYECVLDVIMHNIKVRLVCYLHF